MLRFVCVCEREREKQRKGERGRERGGEEERRRELEMGSEMISYYVLCAHLVPCCQ